MGADILPPLTAQAFAAGAVPHPQVCKAEVRAMTLVGMFSLFQLPLVLEQCSEHPSVGLPISCGS